MQRYWFEPKAEDSAHAETVLRNLGSLLVKLAKVVLEHSTYAECTILAAKLEWAMRKVLGKQDIAMLAPVLPQPVKTVKEQDVFELEMVATAGSSMFPSNSRVLRL